jgi:alanine racemase
MNALSEIVLDRSAMLHNLEALSSLMPKASVAAVVKGNAYGHGLAETVSILEGKVDWFQVDDLDELRALRAISRSPALVLGYVAKDQIAEAIELGCELAIYDAERLPAVEMAARKVGTTASIHVKVDVLLGRQGVLPGELPALLDSISRFPSIRVASVYGHFANIEDTTDLAHAQAQAAAFDDAAAMVQQRWQAAGRHLSATSGVMAFETPSSANTIVRLGIGLYGLYPSESLAASHSALELQPVMTWRTHLAQVKTLPSGHPVGYGLTHVTAQPTRIGIVPQGYSDGFDRGLSNLGAVLVRGSRCPVLGRVAMNMFAIDLSAVPDAAPEDEVVLVGVQGELQIRAEELATQLGTINYEVTTRLSPLLPRRVQ